MASQHLPTEILLDILRYLPASTSQDTLFNFCLVSRQWYNCGIPQLYAHPQIKPTNFDLFARTVCPSINLHIKKSDLATLVKVINLRHIVHHATKSLTARLLGRTKKNLEVFVAPQSSFAVNSFAALAKCSNLRTLDLSLVCEAISFPALGHALRSLKRLQVLYFPRTGVRDDETFTGLDMVWPRLRELHLAGGLTGRFMNMLSIPNSLPNTLTSVSVTNSPVLERGPLVAFLTAIGPQLENLTLCLLQRIMHGDLDCLLDLCPKLKKLSVAVEFLTGNFAVRPELKGLPPHPLQELRVTKSADIWYDEELSPLDLEVGIEYGILINLRRVVVNNQVGWTRKDDSTEELVDLRLALANLQVGNALSSSTKPPPVLFVDHSVDNNYFPATDW